MAFQHTFHAKYFVTLLWAGIAVAATSCTTTTSSKSAGTTQLPRTYWKVFQKDNGTCYLIPRPELTPEYPTVASINNLSRADADAWAARLNAMLQFKVEQSMEGNTLMVRIVPEPLLEDIIDLCRASKPHPFLENRCKKELAWAARGARPDIYMQYDACEAAVMMRSLNRLYGITSPTTNVCPQIDQVAK